jgi:NADPH2:quinone reductase
MRALRFAETGDLRRLALEDVPQVRLESGEARIAVKAAGLNPSDVKNVLGAFPYTTVPRTPGRDFAGVVVEGSPEWLSREVWGCGKEFGFTRDGSHAEQIVVPVSALVPKPHSVSFAQAAAAGVAYVTAWDALERTSVSAAETLLVIGAAGAVGRAAMTIGRLRGAHVIGAVRRAALLDEVNAVGATPLLLPEDGDLRAALSAVGSTGADIAFDCTGAWFDQAAQALSNGGRFAFIAAPAGGRVEFSALAFYRRGGSAFGVNSLLHDGASCARMLRRIGTALERGLMAPPLAPAEVPLKDAVAAYHELSEASSRKAVFVP